MEQIRARAGKEERHVIITIIPAVYNNEIGVLTVRNIILNCISDLIGNGCEFIEVNSITCESLKELGLIELGKTTRYENDKIKEIECFKCLDCVVITNPRLVDGEIVFRSGPLKTIHQTIEQFQQSYLKGPD